MTMNTFLKLTCSFLLVALLTTCRQTDPQPDPLLDDTPRLKSISFSGIPQENISIDQKTKVITVKMPASIPNDVDISVALGDNTEWVNKLFSARSGTLFGCDSCSRIALKDKNNNSTQSDVEYRIKPIATAPLNINPQSEPSTYFIRNTNSMTLEIPMVHLYGNKLPKEAHFTHDKTGEKLVVKRDSSVSDNYFNRIHYGLYANSLAVYLFDEKLIPDSYHVTLVLDDGTLLKVPQSILVTPGTIAVDYVTNYYTGYRVAKGKTLTIDGYNLFEDGITMDLLDAQDKVYPLPGLVFNRYGRQIQIPIPATLNPGQYILRLWHNGIRLPYSYCLRVNVLNDERDRPYIGTIGNEFTPCLLRDPVAVQRAISVSFTSNLYQQALERLSQRAVLKLLSLTGNAAYYGTVVAQDVNRGWDSNSLTIPAAVPPGLYTAILQVLDAQNNVVDESEPYGRILDVK